jgi:asparagine N-glycosylation enzyme membrane subunit Stt3
MSWVRDNTPQDAVFTHWWDYGYWLQSIGNRATVVDGGNSIGYWNHLMGRHGLTSPNDTDTLEFFKTHNVNYFLIDSSDIGKYPAFSSIGSDLNYDRYSWLNTMILDKKQTMEMKNSTMFAYSGGTPLDGDIVYDDNGTKIFLPGGKAGVAGVLVERNKAFEIISQPIGVFIYQNRQYRIPLRYIYDGKLIDFKSGLNAGLFLMDKIDTNSDGGGTIERRGAAIYLSSKTVQSTLARYYLYKEAGPYIKLVHTEDDFAVAYFKSINATSEDILYYGGIRGPIRIWEISYPANIKANPQYLNTSYSDINLLVKVQ